MRAWIALLGLGLSALAGTASAQIPVNYTVAGVLSGTQTLAPTKYWYSGGCSFGDYFYAVRARACATVPCKAA